MTQYRDPKKNTIAERINGILKTKFLNHYNFQNPAQVHQSVEQAVEFYNKQRPHRSLDMLTPLQARSCIEAIKKQWKSYKINIDSQRTEINIYLSLEKKLS